MLQPFFTDKSYIFSSVQPSFNSETDIDNRRHIFVNRRRIADARIGNLGRVGGGNLQNAHPRRTHRADFIASAGGNLFGAYLSILCRLSKHFNFQIA